MSESSTQTKEIDGQVTMQQADQDLMKQRGNPRIGIEIKNPQASSDLRAFVQNCNTALGRVKNIF